MCEYSIVLGISQVRMSHCQVKRSCVSLILPTNDGHPVERITNATEVNHDKTYPNHESRPDAVFRGIRGGVLALPEKLGVPSAARELSLRESQVYEWRAKARLALNQSETERSQAADIACLMRPLACDTLQAPDPVHESLLIPCSARVLSLRIPDGLSNVSWKS